MKRIPLSGERGAGLYAIVDDEDYPSLSAYRWHLHSGGYVCRTVKNRGKTSVILMHRQILPTEHPHIDHINRDKLDNRRSNIRGCSVSGNALNSKMRTDNKSGYRGIAWNAERRKWFVSTRKNGRTIALGRFKTLAEAIVARNKGYTTIHGGLHE